LVKAPQSDGKVLICQKLGAFSPEKIFHEKEDFEG
jgi:hypothetical protein